MNLIFIGTAGCGKTSLTYTFGEWLREELDARVSYINLDPGVHQLQYITSYDVREIVTVDELLQKGFGPNGAMIRA
ncbi:MAG: ATP/GTP-binding protein, partial [Nitrososphaerota archaeon]